MKYGNGNLVVEDSRIKGVWKEYYSKLLNEEFPWDRNGLEDVSVKYECSEQFSKDEVRVAINAAKSEKSPGPSGVAAEMLKTSGEAGIQWVMDICNAVVKDGVVPEDWKRSLMVSVYKGKGDALECGSYRGIKLMDHVLKVLERLVEKRLRDRVSLDDMQ